MSGREPARCGHLEVENGHRVWWELHAGAKEGEARGTVCLLNGLAMHTRAWYPFLDDLAGWDVLLWDYLGQGESSSPDEAVTLPQLAGHLRLVLGAAGLDRIHLVGISYGGFVALEFARLSHHRLATLTLSGILLTPRQVFEMYEATSLRFYAGGRDLFALYTHYLYEKIFGERFLSAVSPDDLEAMRRRFEERYADRIHSLVRLTEAQDPFFAAVPELLDDYRAVPTPVLVLAGEEDRVIPLDAQREMAEIFPNARYEVIPEAGHVVYLERRDLFWPRLVRFMESRDPAA
ncbi:MAG TPA: alpha/beta hydrolase [Thermoanaerobaculia bacterium]|nr:alpha/beta hydrolase [Thermoanaerobaculia bacterium]